MERIRTSFGFYSTADEVIQGVSLAGKHAIVTGGNSGIGIETARVLALAGAVVTLAVRRPDAGQAVAADIRAATGNLNVRVAGLDLSDQASIKSFASNWHGPLHILVNNAGIMALPTLERTTEGWEMQFATNFLGHFALLLQLHGALAAAGGARIVSLNSSANMIAPVLFDDLHFNFLPYEPFVAYGQSKTACVLLAASPLLAGIGGRYFEDCNESEVVSRRPSDFSGGVAPYAVDPANAERLWNLATELLS
jgi:NAD(P)-dependent dehydrogenase (short-subunit alcohol dehydrogenase family)